jgi:hypothetical protein
MNIENSNKDAEKARAQYVAEADRFLVQAGVPTYTDLLAQRKQMITALQAAKHRLDEMQAHYSGAFAHAIHKERTAISDVLTAVGAA